MISNLFTSIEELFLANPVAQIFGFVGMICVWIAFIYKDDLKTIKMLFIANFFWGIMFIMMGAYAGFAAILISSTRLILSIKYKKNIKVFLFIILITLIAGVITYNGVLSILPLITSIFGAYSFFFYTGIQLRMWCLVMSFIWVTYQYYIGSIGGIFNEIIVEILLLTTIYNYMGINGYKFNFMSKIKSIVHPYRNVDYGEYTIVKDKDKISTGYNLRERLRKFIGGRVDRIKKVFRK